MARKGFFVPIAPPPDPRGFSPRLLGRLLGKKAGPRRYRDLDGNTVEEYRPDPLKLLLKSLLAAVREQTGDTWADRQVWEYLDLNPVDLFLSRKGEQWTAGFVFSSCAGMADTSSEVAWHWLDCLARNQPERFQALFREQGLEVAHYPAEGEGFEMEPPVFVPFRDYGYAQVFQPGPHRDLSALDAESLWEEENLLFDLAVCEDDEAFEGRLLAFLRHVDLPALGRECHCSYCDPGFEPLELG